MISVDQNADQRILPYLRQPEEGLEVRHIRQSVPDRSAARNAGILAVRGEWIGYVVL